jgi:hypothetical protein
MAWLVRLSSYAWPWVQERAEHIAEWVRLTGEKQAQAAPVPDRGRVEGRGNKGGINAAVRDLGIDRTEAQRAADAGAWVHETLGYTPRPLSNARVTRIQHECT